jgi:FkbM family methyltransferase
MVFPPDFTFPVEKWETAQYAAQSIAGLSAERRVVVQAGGCAGLWPVALSKYFAHVYTFEPALVNFECLQANVAACANITAVQAALGDTYRSVGLTRPKPKAGLWRVEGEGYIEMLPLDDLLGDVALDALVLDVEGSELQALRGAERLITTHKPLLWFEHRTAEVDGFLTAHGYTPPLHGLGGDCYSVHTSRAH